MGIPCMESVSMLGFWKDPNDLRPSSAIWLKKVKENGQYPIFTEPPSEAERDIANAKRLLNVEN